MHHFERIGLARPRPSGVTSSIATAVLATACILVDLSIARAQGPTRDRPAIGEVDLPTLDGSNNNRDHPARGATGTPYRRLGAANYADRIDQPVDGPNARYLSNRPFADGAQNLFSENGVTQWAWTWGQFVDHTIALRQGGEEPLLTAFDANDPLERFAHDDGVLRATRSAAVQDVTLGPTGVAREQLNANSSYLDAFAVYGGDEARLASLREGVVDGDLSNNGAKLLLTDAGYLPRATERGDAAGAPRACSTSHCSRGSRTRNSCPRSVWNGRWLAAIVRTWMPACRTSSPRSGFVRTA